ncbi:aminotransferase class IV [Daejeonella lutea]|uniref:branched-chain-amino-acid transaminase n=1 Tax=Daejeonella lutea TaxID=572036 RepID=A0A1T5B8E1_9SPHI|nr:aminotransferase class IV [Daejeonella lutea]SKB43554.1 D-alanine transaminase [Daejeonella lutea]
MYVLLNNSIIAEEEATLKISDLAIQRGYGIFDFLKTVGGKPIFLEDHLDRFYSSAEQMRLPVKLSRTELTELLYMLIEKNQLAESGVRITLTGGYSPDGFNIAAASNIIVTQQDFVINRDFEKSIGLMTYDYQRQFASAKTLDYLKAIWLQPVLKEKGEDDILYHDNGVLRECPRANFFLINEKDEILTSKSNILKGVTRKHILKFSNQNFKIDERELTMDDLRHAKEAFISSTTKNILPVTRVDGRVLGDGTPGPVTRALMKQFDKYVYG